MKIIELCGLPAPSSKFLKMARGPKSLATPDPGEPIQDLTGELRSRAPTGHFTSSITRPRYFSAGPVCFNSVVWCLETPFGNLLYLRVLVDLGSHPSISYCCQTLFVVENPTRPHHHYHSSNLSWD